MRFAAICLISLAAVPGSAFAAGDTFDAGEFYAAVFGGGVLVQSIPYESYNSGGGLMGGGTLSLDMGISADGALGFHFDNGIMIEGQFGYLRSNINEASYNSFDFPSSGTVEALYAMANAWYGLDLGPITPFIGGGVGFANLTMDATFTGPLAAASFKDSASTYAWQAGGGVAIDVSESVSLMARYRYFATGSVSLLDGQGANVVASYATQIVDGGLRVSY